MAKKKKTKKRAKSKVEEPIKKNSAFAAYMISAGLILLALFVLIGGFNTGGTLPVGLFHGSYWTVGWVAYLLPLALIYAGVYKFATDDHKIPKDKLISVILAVVL